MRTRRVDPRPLIVYSGMFQGAFMPATSPASQRRSVSPLRFTPEAAQQIRAIREASDLGPTTFLRVDVTGGGCSGLRFDLCFDDAEPGDVLFEADGIRIITRRKHFLHLAGVQVDYVEADGEAGFRFDTPTAGCGSTGSDDCGTASYCPSDDDAGNARTEA